MRVQTFRVGPLGANCYLLDDEKSHDGVIIDPGGEGDYLSEKVLECEVNLTHILLTHGHYDHLLGILPLKLNFNPLICLDKKDLFLYENASKSHEYWESLDSDPLPSPDLFLKGGEGISVGEYTLKVINTPGHTPGGVCFYEKNENILFTGDTIFKRAVGRTDLAYSSGDDLKRSIRNITQLPKQTIIYPGHGKSTTIENEKN